LWRVSGAASARAYDEAATCSNCAASLVNGVKRQRIAGNAARCWNNYWRIVKRPFFFPVSFKLWHAVGYLSEILRTPPLTRNQVELMEKDNIADPEAPGFEALRISPQAIEDILPQLLQAVKKAHDP
jgi:hypothetical protein